MQVLGLADTAAAATTETEYSRSLRARMGNPTSGDDDALLKREQFAISLRKVKRKERIELRRKKTYETLSRIKSNTSKS